MGFRTGSGIEVDEVVANSIAGKLAIATDVLRKLMDLMVIQHSKRQPGIWEWEAGMEVQTRTLRGLLAIRADLTGIPCEP